MSAKIDKALVSRFIAGSFGLAIAHENAPYEPVVGIPYAELMVLQNDTTAATLKHSNETDGVFRVILRYPADGGAIAAKEVADLIFAQFKVGQRLTYSGVTLTITGNQRQPGVPEDGWYKVVLTTPYRAFLAR